MKNVKSKTLYEPVIFRLILILKLQMAERAASVHGLFLRSVHRHPSRIALELQHGAQTRFTYAQVRTMASAAARKLRTRGVGPGSVVATFVDEGHLMIITQLAVLSAGTSFQIPLYIAAVLELYCINRMAVLATIQLDVHRIYHHVLPKVMRNLL